MFLEGVAAIITVTDRTAIDTHFDCGLKHQICVCKYFVCSTAGECPRHYISTVRKCHQEGDTKNHHLESCCNTEFLEADRRYFFQELVTIFKPRFS